MFYKILYVYTKQRLFQFVRGCRIILHIVVFHDLFTVCDHLVIIASLFLGPLVYIGLFTTNQSKYETIKFNVLIKTDILKYAHEFKQFPFFFI